MAATFTLCQDSAALVAALGKLRLSPILFFDCEGHQLGVSGGSLSLISLRSSVAPRATYIFDVLALSPSDLRLLLSLLELPSTQKVCFDGRMDQSALLHAHSTMVANVLDLQVVDVASRAVRGEGTEKQLARLSPFLSPGNIALNRERYLKVHKLTSLGIAMTEYGILDARTDSFVDHTQWMRRPLPSALLQHAVDDVHNISLLFDCFVQQGYISPLLLASSLKYVRLWSDAQPSLTDVYRSHPLLPLEILEPSSPAGATVLCTGCRRSLGRASFPSTSLPHKMLCFVCAAISARAEYSSHGAQFVDDDDLNLYDDDYGADEFDMFEDDDYDYPETAADFDFDGNSESD